MRLPSIPPRTAVPRDADLTHAMEFDVIAADRSADVLFPANYQLAESALWCSHSGKLAYVDIAAGNVHRLDVTFPREAETFSFDGSVSAIVPATDGRLLTATEAGLGLLDTVNGSFETLVEPDSHLDEHRYNDGKCDRHGGLILSTMSKNPPRTATGKLYNFKGLRRSTLLDDLRVPNSICFSPDGLRLYACDTVAGIIWSFSYNPDEGTIGERREFAPVDIAPGKPDGATVDAEGCVWSARYNGGVVVRLSPDGKLDRVIQLPVTQITSCAFGGAELDTLFITTARQNLDPEKLANQPLAGSIFAAAPGVKGLPETPYQVGPNPRLITSRINREVVTDSIFVNQNPGE